MDFWYVLAKLDILYTVHIILILFSLHFFLCQFARFSPCNMNNTFFWVTKHACKLSFSVSKFFRKRLQVWLTSWLTQFPVVAYAIIKPILHNTYASVGVEYFVHDYKKNVYAIIKPILHPSIMWLELSSNTNLMIDTT